MNVHFHTSFQKAYRKRVGFGTVLDKQFERRTERVAFIFSNWRHTRDLLCG